MAVTTSLESTDGPVLALINKRLRALRKKYNRIVQMEESATQGKPINKEQAEVLRSKPSVVASIDELEKLRQPLSTAVSEEIALAVQRHEQQSSIVGASADEKSNGGECDDNGGHRAGDAVVEDLLNLLYFGSLFDVKAQSDFTATMLTRTHERGCCLTYDYVTDDATDLLDETDLDRISMLGGLLISRPVDSSLSHKNALQRCMEHAKLWLAFSDQPIEPSAQVSYAGLREKLNKIMASDYFTTTPEIKAPVEMAAAANYVPFQVPVQVEGSIAEHQHEGDAVNFQGLEMSDTQSDPAEELHKNQLETESPSEAVFGQEQANTPAEVEHVQVEGEPKEQQYASRRNYQSQKGGRGNSASRRGYSNGRGGRGGSRGGGGYQNGRYPYYDQPGNYYPRNYHNHRGRSNRGGRHPYTNNHSPGDVGVAS
uniref:Uncharacterized protein MANES_05G095400 n=1 Tax=Rhizophora mucronata TaxID=61149 RepID=A0A2P2K7R0_RHIMU